MTRVCRPRPTLKPQRACFHDLVRFNELLQAGSSEPRIVLDGVRDERWKPDFSPTIFPFGTISSLKEEWRHGNAGRLRELNCNPGVEHARERASSRRPDFLSLSLSPPSLSLFARYIKQASNNRISSVVSPAKLLIKCNGVTQLLRS